MTENQWKGIAIAGIWIGVGIVAIALKGAEDGAFATSMVAITAAIGTSAIALFN